MNGFEDGDGCPEPDRDGDGLPDKKDKCPGEAEIVNFHEDDDGCPDMRPEPIRNGILARVTFKIASDVLDSASLPVLEDFAARMRAYPGSEIEIHAHVDNQAGRNARSLTQMRALAVAAFLASKGVDARRMKPLGYGAARPVSSNRTAKGRESNRRIEILKTN